MRTLVIGDVHGCLDELRALLVRCSFDGASDRLVLLGDLLDRGPDPVGCVQFARELGAESVVGNHEETHLRFRSHRLKREADPGYRHPMRPFEPQRMQQHEALSDEDWRWLEALPHVLPLTEGFVAVHAGLLPGRPLADQPRRAMVRLRYLDDDGDMLSLEQQERRASPSRFWIDAYDGPVSVAHGHAVLSLTDPVCTQRPHGVEVFSLDTGCVFGGRLTALVLDDARPGERTFVQVDALRRYAPMRVGPEASGWA